MQFASRKTILGFVSARTQSVTPNADYAELKRRVSAARLFEAQPLYYAGTLAFTLILLGSGFALLFASPGLVVDSVAALLLAVASGQLGFVLHDTAHRQIWPSGRRSDVLALVVGPLLLGISAMGWKRKHDLHHAHPNDVDRDPDIQIRVFAFTEEQARTKPWYIRPLTRYQAYLIFPLLLFEGIQLRGSTAKYLVTTRSKLRRTEASLLVAHLAGYAALVIAAVGPARALVVIGIHQGLFGLYAGSVFAPNHKGMPLSDGELTFFERQVVTARNVRGHWATDWFYGGLNYQIEHHLFPTLPRNGLRQAQQIVRSFCHENGVPYLETGVWESYRQLIRSMHATSRPQGSESFA
jgi:fatty acid desaturase